MDDAGDETGGDCSIENEGINITYKDNLHSLENLKLLLLHGSIRIIANWFLYFQVASSKEDYSVLKARYKELRKEVKIKSFNLKIFPSKFSSNTSPHFQLI